MAGEAYYARMFPALAAAGIPTSQLAHRAMQANTRATAAAMEQGGGVMDPNIQRQLMQREVTLLNLAGQGVPMEAARDIAFGQPIGTTAGEHNAPPPAVTPPPAGDGGGQQPSGWAVPAVMAPREVSSPLTLEQLKAMMGNRFRR